MLPTPYVSRSLFSSMGISAQGLSVQRTRMNTVSENLANVDTTRTEDGTPYRRKIVQIERGRQGEQFADIFQDPRIEMSEPKSAHFPAQPFRHIVDHPRFGTHVRDIIEDPSPFKMVFDPAHPDANDEGYVAMPNINPVQEMIDLITASRSYEANVTALNTAKDMVRNALRI